MPLDPVDIQLLDRLQRDGQATANDLSEALNLSASQIGRRRQRLEAEGYITGIGCRVDPDKVGLSVQAFIQIQTLAHSGGTHQEISRLINTQREITAAWTLTGEADYMLRGFCADLSALNRLIQDVLLPHPSIGRVKSQIVMHQLKTDTPLPISLGR